MGELYANRDRFGVALRVNYMNVKSEEIVDGLIIDSIDTDLKMGVNNFWFGFRYCNIGNNSSVSGNTLKVDMTQAGPMAGWAFTF